MNAVDFLPPLLSLQRQEGMGFVGRDLGMEREGVYWHVAGNRTVRDA